jgi:hypothetical protein
MSAGRDGVARVADLVLERYRLGELPVAERERLERELAKDADLRERLRALERSDQEIGRLYPPEWFADRLRARLAADGGTAPSTRTRKRSPFRPVVAALTAAVVLMVALPRVFAPGGGARPVEQGEPPERLKGLSPGLTLFRKTRDGSEALKDGDRARPGDLIRVGYRAAGRTYGAIVSIDGRGAVTLHLPRQGTRAVRLGASGDTILLDWAYELDDAPRWERFYFVTGETAFEIEPVLEAARRAAVEGTPERLPLPPHLEQTALSLEKGTGR